MDENAARMEAKKINPNIRRNR